MEGTVYLGCPNERDTFFECFLILWPDIVEYSPELQALPGSSSDSPDVLDGGIWSDRHNGD
jgi:hypothetical protein